MNVATDIMFYIDPVCKKKLRRKEEFAILKYGGTVYHLCCKACKEEFQEHPGDFVAPDASSAHRDEQEENE